jgi:hypothetical protein
MAKLLLLLAINCAFATFAFYTANDAVGDVPNWASTVCDRPPQAGPPSFPVPFLSRSYSARTRPWSPAGVANALKIYLSVGGD